MIKIVPYFNENYVKLVEEAKKSNNFCSSSWWYLHGELEKKCRYDGASIINVKECLELVRLVPFCNVLKYNGLIWKGDSNNLLFKPYLFVNDIVKCEVVGIEEPCIGYFWVIDEAPLEVTLKSGEIFRGIYWNQKGLVCLESDKEGCEYALEKYKEKALIL